MSIVKEGDRIAQLICEKAAFPLLMEVPELARTERNDAGFGSTGTAFPLLTEFLR